MALSCQKNLVNSELVFGVSDFVAVFNQTVAYAYPSVTIEGELANFRVSKNRWVYFDLKDETSSVRFFGSVYTLSGPLEEGMKLRVTGSPQLHAQFGFSITVRNIQLAGEGTIKKAAKLLEAKLEKEGLFDPARKRTLPYPPRSIGLIASAESAAYSDFVKVLRERWGDVSVEHLDVQVQGEAAAQQIISAIEFFNSQADAVEVLIITRGGGSADDLQSFSDERVTRAIAASRIPTLVAVGHERDVSLAERAADQRASTPSNAAELLVPSRVSEQRILHEQQQHMWQVLRQKLTNNQETSQLAREELTTSLLRVLDQQRSNIETYKKILNLANPTQVLKRGYVVVRKNGTTIRSKKQLQTGEHVSIQFNDGEIGANVTD